MAEKNDFKSYGYLKSVETQYGEIIKVSFRKDQLEEMIRDLEATGTDFLNCDIKRSKEGNKPYMVQDMWKPKKGASESTASNPSAGQPTQATPAENGNDPDEELPF